MEHTIVGLPPTRAARVFQDAVRRLAAECFDQYYIRRTVLDDAPGRGDGSSARLGFGADRFPGKPWRRAAAIVAWFGDAVPGASAAATVDASSPRGAKNQPDSMQDRIKLLRAIGGQRSFYMTRQNGRAHRSRLTNVGTGAINGWLVDTLERVLMTRKVVNLSTPSQQRPSGQDRPAGPAARRYGRAVQGKLPSCGHQLLRQEERQ